MNDGVKLWKALFDINFNPAQPNASLAAAVPKPVSEVASEAESRVLTPMENPSGTAAVVVSGLKAWRDNTLRSDKKWTLTPFVANPKLVLPKKD